MGLGIVDLMMALEERFDFVLPSDGSGSASTVLTIRGMIDWIVTLLNEPGKGTREENELDKLEAETFERLREMYAVVTGIAPEYVRRESSCHKALSNRKRARFLKKVVAVYPEIYLSVRPERKRSDDTGCLVFAFETAVVAVTAVLSVVNVVWLLVFIAVLAFVLYDVIVPGPFMGREFLRVLAPFGTLGELSGFLASKRTARRDEKGNPWTTESVTAVVLEVVENESGIKRDKIDLDMHLSELD